MKIAFPLLSLFPSGGVKVVFRLADALHCRGHDVSLIVPSGTGGLCHYEGVTVIESPSIPIMNRLPPLNLLAAVFPLAKSLRSYDIVVANYAPTTLPTKMAHSNHTRTYYLVQHMETGFFSPLSLEYWVTRLSYDAFDESSFFTVSEWLSDYIRKRTGHSAVIIPPGIDHEVFFPRSRTPHSGKRVLFLSRPSKWRGVEVLIDAMNIVCNRIPDVELIAVGGSSKTYVAPCPISYVHPTNSELADLYASCDVFVLPSLLEGLPVPPLEAMACGGAVVLTDCLGTRDYALPGENCLMVPPGDSCAMAESIINVLEDDGVSLKLRRNGPTTAEPWTYDRMTRVFVESLEKNSPLD